MCFPKPKGGTVDEDHDAQPARKLQIPSNRRGNHVAREDSVKPTITPSVVVTRNSADGIPATLPVSDNQSTQDTNAGTNAAPQLDEPVSAVVSSRNSSVPQDPSPIATDVELEAKGLWEVAYQNLRTEDADLIRALETIIKEDVGLAATMDIQNEMSTIVDRQKKKMESKQWSFHVLGKEVKVRETVDNIFSLIDQSKDLIAAGMTFAPAYVSIPWTAVATLIPLMLSDAKQHQEAIDGLDRVAQILWCYTIPEESLLSDPGTRSRYRKAVLDLYTTLLRYQALAAQYFGKSTIKRIWGNVKETTWSDISARIIVLDDDCRRCIGFLAIKDQQRGIKQLMTVLGEQGKSLQSILKNTDDKRYEKKQVLEWMSTIEYGADHQNVRNTLGESYHHSGRWLFNDNSDFQSWQRSSDGVFLLKGTAGTGKSSLTSIVIQDFIDMPKAYLGYFYCSRNEKASRRSDTTMIIRSLIKSLSVNGHPAFKDFIEDYRGSESRRADGCELQLPRCLTLLQKSFSENPTMAVILVLDAIDECANPGELLTTLNSIWESGQNNLRLFLSSRLDVDVKAQFPMAIDANIGLSNTKDIQSYLEKEIPKRRLADKDPVMTDTQAKDLKEVLLEYADGMFQWVALEVDIFLGGHIKVEDTIDEKIEALKQKNLEPILKLNTAYDEIYATAIGTEDPYWAQIVVTALQWMLCAYEDLSIEELVLVASIKPDGTAFKNVKASRLLRCCGNFIIQNAGRLRLAHLTVRPYLEKRQASDVNPFQPPTTNLRVAVICLHFLIPNTQHQVRFGPEADMQYRKMRTYSNKYWTLHSREAKHNGETPEELDSFIKSLYKDQLPSSPVHLAVRDSDRDAVQYGIASGADIGLKNRLGNTPLHEAVRWTSLPVLTLLLEAGVSTDSQNQVGDTALHIASALGLEDFAKELLCAGADTELSNYHGHVPLHVCAHYGNVRLVRLLLRFGANIDQVDTRGNTTLHYASMTSQEDLVATLLGAGCKTQLKNKDGEMPLNLAQRNEATSVVGLLKAQLSIDMVLASQLQLGTVSKGQQLNRQQHRIQDIVLNFDTSGLCSHCDLSRWYKSAIRGLSDVFHHSCASLLQSASSGCRLCKLFMEELGALGLESNDLMELESSVTIQMILCSSQNSTPLKINGQDLLVLDIGSEIRLELELCLDPAKQSKLGDTFVGRPISQTSSLSSSSSMAHTWLETCKLQHSKCQRSPRLEVPWLPKRVINVQNPQKPFLFMPGNQQADYAFLSFSWGPGTTINKSVQKDLGRFQKEIPFSELVPTFKDAISLTATLGIRYLWIDALCIVQDYAADWEEEISVMGNYIEQATCVISSLASIDATSSIYTKRPGPTSLLKISLSTEDSGLRDYLHVRRPLVRPHESPADFVRRRTWRLPEAVLAKRIIYFHEEEIFRNCFTCLKSEGSTWDQESLFQLDV